MFDPETWTNRDVIIAAISALAAVVVAGFGVLTVLIQRTRRAATVAADQTANSHTTNLRDDLDGKHDDTLAILRHLVDGQVSLEKQMKSVRGTLSRQGGRIRRLERPTERKPA